MDPSFPGGKIQSLFINICLADFVLSNKCAQLLLAIKTSRHLPLSAWYTCLLFDKINPTFDVVLVAGFAPYISPR